MKRNLLFVLALFVSSFAFSQTTYFSEDFEAGLPTDWTAEDEWMHGDNASLSSMYLNYNGNTTSFMAFNDDNAGAMHLGGGALISSMIDLTAATAPLFLEVNVFFANADFQGADETLKFSVSTDAGATWEELSDYGGLAWNSQLYFFDDYAGQNVWLRWDYDDGMQWNFGCAIDDITIADEPLTVPRRNYTFTVNGGSQFTECAQNIDYEIEGLVFNQGYETITSFDVDLTANGTTTTISFPDVNIELNDAMTYALPDKLNTGVDFASYSLAISNVNGDMTPDEVTVDNSASITFNPQALHPDQGVVVEEATGTWCTWCPRGTVYLSEMSKRFPDNFVGIAVHNSDPMVLTEYDDAITGFPDFPGFPSVVYNRESIQDPGELVDPFIIDAQMAPVATIALGGEENGDVFNGSVKVTFTEDVTANHSVVLILTEDELTEASGVPGTWNQTSGAYSGGGNGAMGGFEYLPTSVPSHFWPYDHVGRALVGGYDGLNEIVGDYSVGSSPSVYFEGFTMEDGWNRDNMHVVALLVNEATGSVVNAIQGKYNDVIATGAVSSNQEVLDQAYASVYPNPADQMTFVKMNILENSNVAVELFDNLGRRVAVQNYGELKGFHELAFDVSNVSTGMYLMHISVEDKILTKKINIH